jgi:hypothetical protein
LNWSKPNFLRWPTRRIYYFERVFGNKVDCAGNLGGVPKKLNTTAYCEPAHHRAASEIHSRVSQCGRPSGTLGVCRRARLQLNAFGGYPVGQLIGVIATIYNFVRMPACGAMTANSRQRICTRGIRKPARVRSYTASASSSLSSAAMRFASNTDCPRCKPRPRSP